MLYSLLSRRHIPSAVKLLQRMISAPPIPHAISIRENAALLTTRDPAKQYDFLRADIRHKDEIVDFILNHYLTLEPQSVAFGVAADNGRCFVDEIVTEALMLPLSCLVVHRASGQLIGVRILSLRERDWQGYASSSEPHEENNIFDKLEANFWNLQPEANQVIRREFTLVQLDHQRRGIAQHMLHLGLDFAFLRASGIDGIVSEASSIANQTLLLKNGYQEIARSSPEDYVRSSGKSVVFPDATSAVKQLYMRLQ